MSQVYVETSAVLTWLLGESRADHVRAAIDGAETVVTSVLTLMEVERVLVRAEHEERVVAASAQTLRGMLRRAQTGWMLMELTQHVSARVGRPFPVEPVRTLDAVHLSTALEFAQVFPDLSVVSTDQRILSNCEPLGLGVAL